MELNYSLRSHIFVPVKRKIVTDAFEDELEIRTLEPMEIFAAKANALMSRAAARDLYDFNNMIFYASISAEVINKEFDTSAIDGLNFPKIRRDLFPVLREKDNFDLEERKESAKEFIKKLMVLTPLEREYLVVFERKEYKPELLFEDKSILAKISRAAFLLSACHP